jgi:hypothetical protein
MPTRVEIPKKELKDLLEEGKNRKEIAKHFGCSVGTVNGRVKFFSFSSRVRNKEAKKQAEKLTAKMAFDQAEQLYKDASKVEMTMQRALSNLEGASIYIKDQIMQEGATKQERSADLKLLKEVCDSLINAYEKFVNQQDEVKERRLAFVFREQVRIWLEKQDPVFVRKFLNEVFLIETAGNRLSTDGSGYGGESSLAVVRQARSEISSSDNPDRKQN